MARLFDDAQTEYLQIESPVIETYPFAMACKFRMNDGTANAVLMWCGDKDSTEHYAALLAAGSIDNHILAQAHRYGAADPYYAESTAGFTQDVWGHAAGIWLGVSERHAYINGENKGSNTGTVGAMANHDRTAIGAARDSSPGTYTSGDIAEAGIWDLTNWGANDAEREANFEKILPSLVKEATPNTYPLGLKSYWDLIRGLNDKIGGYNLTANGTIVVAHPRVIQPCGAL